MANLFTSQTPALPDNSDGTPGITTATTIVFAEDGTVSGVRFYATSTVGGTYTGALWEVTDNDAGTGTLLASKTAGVTPTGGTWNTITFDTPVSVTAGTPYRTGLFSGAGRYVATSGFFSSGLTNGDISAPAHNGAAGPYTVFQGTFIINAALTYPTSTAGSASYFVDVEYTAITGDTSASPNGIEVPVALGAPAGSFAATTAQPAGIDVPVALGAPTSAFAATTAQPAGIEVPVSLGAPAVYHYVRPDGIEVPIALGAPAIEAPAGPSLDVGSWAGLLTAVQSARADAELNRERERHPVECPYDGWPLTPTDRGLHCEFGGHVITPQAA